MCWLPKKSVFGEMGEMFAVFWTAGVVMAIDVRVVNRPVYRGGLLAGGGGEQLKSVRLRKIPTPPRTEVLPFPNTSQAKPKRGSGETAREV